MCGVNCKGGQNWVKNYYFLTYAGTRVPTIPVAPAHGVRVLWVLLIGESHRARRENIRKVWKNAFLCAFDTPVPPRPMFTIPPYPPDQCSRLPWHPLPPDQCSESASHRKYAPRLNIGHGGGEYSILIVHWNIGHGGGDCSITYTIRILYSILIVHWNIGYGGGECSITYTIRILTYTKPTLAWGDDGNWRKTNENHGFYTFFHVVVV